jgi:hypothetical protein
MDISYLLCSRTDMAVGNFDSTISEWVSATANIYKVRQSIQKVLPRNLYYVAAFISGFSTTGNSFEITINNKAYDIIQRNLMISFYCTNPAVLTITISYVIYPVSHPTLHFSFGAIPQVSDNSY